MKTVCRILPFVALFALTVPKPALATTITITDGSSTGGVLGDYYIIQPGTGASAPGQVVDVLAQQVTTQSDTTPMSELWNYLNGQSVSSANKLLFGLGVNEPNSSEAAQYVDVTALTMTFNLPGGGSKTFDLGSGNTIHVKDWINGTHAGDALIGVDLGFDFMKTYGASSADLFTISSTLANAGGGFEIYFLNSSLYDLNGGDGGGVSPVPEPASLALFGTGLVFVAQQVRRRRQAR